MFDGFTRKVSDNSTHINQNTDSYNSTVSWSQGISEVGNTTVNVNPAGTTLQQIMPFLIIGSVVMGVIALGRRNA